ncbi:uncharacterized protein LOC142625834 [Castanea sativa]|uniref:uncharacterized protein LOC142625834 n=1 Tax=Castanea sativa TaxID=21020 RepID=UPI003F653E9F
MVDDIVDEIPCSISDEMNGELLADFTREEVVVALNQIEPLKAPGPDGLPPLFFQHYCIYKLMSKVVTDRMNGLLPLIISDSQSAFQSDKAISDNILVAFETLHHMKNQKSKNRGFLALKLDMSKVFHAKYFPNGSVLDAKPSVGSYAWQSIVKAKNLVKSGLLWRVGDGKQIKIFEDRWLPGEEPTKVISPPNTILVEWTMSRLLNPNVAGWNTQLVDSIFLPFKAQRIKGIPNYVTNQEDCVSWPKCKIGLYSMKSEYQILCEAKTNGGPSRSTDEGVKLFWKHIWHTKVPNKIKVFLWRACSNALPTKVGLHKRKIMNNTILLRVNFPRIDTMWDLVSFVQAKTGELANFAMVAWAIWQRRNKLRCKETSTPVHKIFKSALSLLVEFQQRKPRLAGQSHSNPTQWQPPPPNVVKVNFDGDVFGDSHKARVGVVIRNEHGE